MTAQEISSQRGIPAAPFVNKIEDFVTSRENVEPVLKDFQQLIAQRHIMILLDKIPEMDKTLRMLHFLQKKNEKKESFDTYFELNDTLYFKIIIPSTDKAGVWLGYPVPEAIEFLMSRISSAKISLKKYEEDLEFIRENITILEVNIARIYNWDVAQRRIEKSSGIKK
ncbi:hypothetical protein PMAC_000016 [Pneumocystis sp. 'macacae']|nr:hypothetical protein PMAC_000016 [Pneumocystis sp. 'macacae']